MIDLQMFFTIFGVLSFIRLCFKVEAWVERLGDKHGW